MAKQTATPPQISYAPTPGPWHTGDDLANGGGGMNIVDARGYRVAHTAEVCHAGETIIGTHEACANAYVIAAAADMLTELRHQLQWATPTGKRYARIERLIAQAEGRI